MTDANATQESITINSGTGYGKTDVDQAAEDFIAQISAEFKANDIQSDDSEALKTTEEPVKTPESTQKASTEANNTVGDQTRAPYNRPETQEQAGLERLVAREADLREREAAFKRKEEEFASKKPVDKEIEELFGTSASEALRRMGYDPDQVVRRVIAERMGDKAPDKLKQEIKEAERDSQYTRRLNEIEAKLAQKERELATRNYIDQIVSGAKEHVKGIDKYREYAPTVAQVAGTNPDRVHSEIMDEISRDAQIRGRIDPNGAPLSYEEATKRVESRWSELAKVFKPQVATELNVSSNKPSMPKTPEKTPNPPTPKPPDRPLAPWLQKQDIEEEGIRAAMAEYRRVEVQKP